MDPTISKVGIVKSSETKGIFPKTHIELYVRNTFPESGLPSVLIESPIIRGRHKLSKGTPLRLIFSYKDVHNVLRYDILDEEGRVSSTHYKRLF